MAQVQQRLTPRKTVKVESPVKPVKFFKFADGARPTAGARLFAFTEASLTFLGLREGKKANKDAVVALMGPRTVQYHIGLDNFEEKNSKIGLTKNGQAKFQQRRDDNIIDAKATKAFLAAIKTGKANELYGIKEKNLIPVSMPL